MKKLDNKTIIIGIGNTGRQDDGLGWLFLDALKDLNIGFDLEYRYQLQIEDAELISNYSSVIFVDATKAETQNGFEFSTCLPNERYNFSTHALEPETILYLSKKLYNHQPKASILAIQGFTWELQIGLSKKGAENLAKAITYFNETIIEKTQQEHHEVA